MTDLQKLYTKIRLTQNKKHRAAIRAMAKETGLDEGSIQRALARANREDERRAKKAKRTSGKKAA